MDTQEKAMTKKVACFHAYQRPRMSLRAHEYTHCDQGTRPTPRQPNPVLHSSYRNEEMNPKENGFRDHRLEDSCGQRQFREDATSSFLGPLGGDMAAETGGGFNFNMQITLQRYICIYSSRKVKKGVSAIEVSFLKVPRPYSTVLTANLL